MKLVVAICLLFNQGLALNIVNERRACPDGYFYAGEIEPESEKPQTRDMVVEKGERSQVYSCYAFRTWNTSWTNATKQCSDIEGAPGELLSVNNIEESKILTSELFLTGAFGSGNLPQTTFTSGISLAPEVWTWFGAGKEEDSEVNQTIVDSMTSNNTNNTVGYTECIAVTFRNKSQTALNSTGQDWMVVLEYTVVPCVNEIASSVCEVRVYEQVWYVWFTTNWLQILFLLTLVLLLVSSCVTFQIWVGRPNRRPRGTIPRPSDAPPAYSVREDQSQTTKAKLAAAAEKYTEKGKDIMAKVVFYRKPEDKQRLAEDA